MIFKDERMVLSAVCKSIPGIEDHPAGTAVILGAHIIELLQCRADMHNALFYMSLQLSEAVEAMCLALSLKYAL